MTNPMSPDRRARLEALMAGMAAGDDAMISALMFEFRDELERAARFHANSVSPSTPNDGDIVGLVADFAFVIADVAKSWRPDGGALPWTFARRALRQKAIDVLVTPIELRKSLDDGNFGDIADEGSRALGVIDGEYLGTLIDMADQMPEVAKVLDRLSSASDEHVAIALEFRIQRQQGDRSAAATVAERFDKTPANVRQIHHRVWKQLADLELDDMMVS